MNDFKSLNSLGFLPKEGEQPQAFLQRACSIERKTSLGLTRCKQLFDAEPTWVEVIEEQKGLNAWQGAVLWIQEDEQGNTSPLIQVSPRLKAAFLRTWYPEEEVIAHELIHAVRLPLRSCRFEEIIAYHTSANPLRKYLGPLIRRPHEVYVFLAALILGWSGLLFGTSLLLLIPLSVSVYGFVRLLYCQRLFASCKAKLARMLEDKEKTLAFLARLTDDEIARFAHSSLEEILSYAQEAQQTSLRWQVLLEAYPLD